MGLWREDCPDCFDEHCVFCDKRDPIRRQTPVRKTPLQLILEDIDNNLLLFIQFLRKHKIIS